MKKTALFLLAIATLISCGPHRMKCGPRRCHIQIKSNPHTIEPTQKKANT